LAQLEVRRNSGLSICPKESNYWKATMGELSLSFAAMVFIPTKETIYEHVLAHWPYFKETLGTPYMLGSLLAWETAGVLYIASKLAMRIGRFKIAALHPDNVPTPWQELKSAKPEGYEKALKILAQANTHAAAFSQIIQHRNHGRIGGSDKEFHTFSIPAISSSVAVVRTKTREYIALIDPTGETLRQSVLRKERDKNAPEVFAVSLGYSLDWLQSLLNIIPLIRERLIHKDILYSNIFDREKPGEFGTLGARAKAPVQGADGKWTIETEYYEGKMTLRGKRKFSLGRTLHAETRDAVVHLAERYIFRLERLRQRGHSLSSLKNQEKIGNLQPLNHGEPGRNQTHSHAPHLGDRVAHALHTINHGLEQRFEPGERSLTLLNAVFKWARSPKGTLAKIIAGLDGIADYFIFDRYFYNHTFPEFTASRGSWLAALTEPVEYRKVGGRRANMDAIERAINRKHPAFEWMTLDESGPRMVLSSNVESEEAWQKVKAHDALIALICCPTYMRHSHTPSAELQEDKTNGFRVITSVHPDGRSTVPDIHAELEPRPKTKKVISFSPSSSTGFEGLSRKTHDLVDVVKAFADAQRLVRIDPFECPGGSETGLLSIIAAKPHSAGVPA
jgi:hypothetical protein